MSYPYSCRHALAVAIVLALATPTTHAATRSVAAQTPDQARIDAAAVDSRNLILPVGAFDPLVESVDLRGVDAAPSRLLSPYAIVQFRDGQTSQRKRLEHRGVQFLNYVPNNAYQVRLNGASLESLRADPAVRWVESIQPGYKLDPTLWSQNRASFAPHVEGLQRIDVFAFAGESAQHIAATVQKRVPQARVMIQAERGDAPRVRVDVAPAQLDALISALLAMDQVAWVAPFVEAQLNNSGGIASIQGNLTINCTGNGTSICGSAPLWDHGLLGSGQIVSVSDSGTTPNMAFFTTLDKGFGPRTEITFPDSPRLPATGNRYPDNKLYGYWVQPGATAYDNTRTCPGGSAVGYHGTHTTATVVGDAAGSFGANTFTASTPTSAAHDGADGMAPNAQLLFQDIGNDISGCLAINDLRGTIEQAHAGGAHIHSASWGASDFGAYAGDDNNVDYALNTLEDFIFVVSAGNSGTASIAAGCVNRVGSVCYQSTGSPGNAKNSITVGALGHGGLTTIAGFSSRGPTADGRIKPDIMAPGSSTISAAGNLNVSSAPQAPVTSSKSGTSMAAPTIAGNAALVQQYFADGFYPRGSKTAADGFTASGMLMKAVLLNGTNPLSATVFGGNDFGWGRMWSDGNLWFANTLAGGDDNRRLRLFERTNAAGLRSGESHQYAIANVLAGQELRATLTWYDVEAAPGAALTLVNNLDLEVIAPDGSTVYKGNVFTAGVSSAGGTADIKNTVEQVRLPVASVVPGAYTFRVSAANVPGTGRSNTSTQGYALAVSGAFGLPDQPALAAPASLAVASNTIAGVGISFASVAGAQGYQLYRADGSCAAASSANFRMAATAAASPLLDARPQGGFGYAYRVRAIGNDVEGELSSCIDVPASNAACTLQPTFDENSIVRNQLGNSCHIGIYWTPASPACGDATGLRYQVLRDTNPYFTGATVLADGVTIPAYDDRAVSSGQVHYYGIVARDGVGNSSIRGRVVAGTPLGADGADGNTYLDNADSHVYVDMDNPWRITNTRAASGLYSYHSGADGGNYNSYACSTMTTPPIRVQAGAQLRFNTRYNIEDGYDGMAMEISTDNGQSWSDLPPDGGYPGSFSQTGSPAGNACGYAASHGAFTGATTATSNNAANPSDESTLVFKPFTRDLSAYAGQSIKVRWRVSSDGGLEYSGAFIDDISLGGTGGDRMSSDGFESGRPMALNAVDPNADCTVSP